MSAVSILWKLIGYDGSTAASSSNPLPVQLVNGDGTEGRDSFVSGAGPFTLAHAWNGKRFLVFFDGILQPIGNLVATSGSTTVTLGGGVTSSYFSTITVIYTY